MRSIDAVSDVKTAKTRSGLRRSAIDLNVVATSHVEVLRRLGALAAGCCDGIDAASVTSALLARERLGSTMLIPGVLLPHARLQGLDEALVCCVRLLDPVRVDEGELNLAICILVPETEPALHLDLLRYWASLLRQADRVGALLCASSAERFMALTEEA